MTEWHWWKCSETVRRVENITPQLASWNAKTHPDQVRIGAYLADIVSRTGVLPDGNQLCLRLKVDVGHASRLTHHHDLENYLTPLFGTQCFDPRRFVFVSAAKRVGGGSSLSIGHAEATAIDLEGWKDFSAAAGHGAGTKQWKEQLRTKLAAQVPQPLHDGPVDVQIAWRCSPNRCWSSLWKPTGDAMGPVLGEPYPTKPFHPNDGRIVSVGFHLLRDASLGHNVDVAMWWRHLEIPLAVTNRIPTDITNLLESVPSNLSDELVQTIVSSSNMRIERIISHGHASPPGFWYDQEWRECVLVLSGRARLRLEGDEPLELRPGAWVDIPAHRRHRVEWTDPDQPTVWLAIHISSDATS